MGIGDGTESGFGGDGRGAAGGGAPFRRRRFLAAAGVGAVTVLGCGPAKAAVSAPAARRPRPAVTRPFYLGTYTSGGGGTGVGLAAYDTRTGRLSGTGTLKGVANPSFLTRSASGTHLYAVDEQSGGAVTAVAVGSTGTLTVLGSRSTSGSGPCHLSVHAGGKHLLTANYDSGSVSVHPLAADGSILALTDLVQHTGSGPDPDRQEGPHAHMVLSDVAGTYVLAVDLGTDTVYTYRLNVTTGKLAAVSQAEVPAGSGPRHLAFHPSGAYAYLANELGDSVIVCGYDPATGKVTPGSPQPTVPAGSASAVRNYPAEVVVSADGAFVYVSNRGHDSIARFAVEDGGATLRLLDTVPSGGAYPRHISLDPTGTLLFAGNQNSDTVTSFHVDAATGALTSTGTSFAAPMPVCVLPA